MRKSTALCFVMAVISVCLTILVQELTVRINRENVLQFLFSTASRPILVIGDSFTFGDEVEDSETWAAYLEKILNKRVLNVGVGAYGIDQAFLPAELLLDKYDQIS